MFLFLPITLTKLEEWGLALNSGLRACYAQEGLSRRGAVEPSRDRCAAGSFKRGATLSGTDAAAPLPGRIAEDQRDSLVCGQLAGAVGCLAELFGLRAEVWSSRWLDRLGSAPSL